MVIISFDKKNMKKSKFINNLSWSIFAKCVQMVAQLIIGMFVVRYLGSEAKGALDYTAAFVTFGSSIVGLGLGGVVVNELCSSENSDAKVLGSLLRVQFFVSILTLISTVLVISLLNINDIKLIVIGIIQGISLIFNVFNTIVFWFQARNRMKEASIIQLLSQFIVIIYKIIIILFKCDVIFFAFSVTLESMSTAIIYYCVYRKHDKEKLSYDKSLANNILKQAIPFLVADIMIFLYQCMDKMMIGSMLDKSSVGCYSAATTIANMWALIPSSFLNVIRPKVMESKKKDEMLFKKRLTEMFTGLIYSALPFSILMSFIGKYVLLILYGEDFIAGVGALSIVVWYCAFSYIGGGRNVYLICENKNKYVQTFCIWGAVSNAILNFVLIPRYGINGAAVATLLTQIIANVIVPACYKETRDYIGYVFKGLIRIDYVIKDAKEIFKK